MYDTYLRVLLIINQSSKNKIDIEFAHRVCVGEAKSIIAVTASSTEMRYFYDAGISKGTIRTKTFLSMQHRKEHLPGKEVKQLIPVLIN